MVYLAAADGDGSGAAAGEGNGTNFGSKDKLDEKAPDIIGLKYKSETKLDYANYFKIYHYDDDITLLEIDLSKDTDKDPESWKRMKKTRTQRVQIIKRIPRKPVRVAKRKLPRLLSRERMRKRRPQTPRA